MDPTEKNYNNKNYCWHHDYDTSDPHTSDTCSRKMFGNKTDATRCDPMGGLKKIRNLYGIKD